MKPVIGFSSALLAAMMMVTPAMFRQAPNHGGKRSLYTAYKNTGLTPRERKWREKERAANRKALGIT